MRLRPSEAGPRLAVGVQGSGKSHGMGKDVVRGAQSYPAIVLDTNEEWSDFEPPEGLRAVATRTVARAVKEIEENGAQLVIVQPDDADDPLVLADQICEWAIWHKGIAGVVFPEAHDLFPMGSKLPKYVRKAVKRARHFRVAFFADTQRLAELHPAITSAASVAELRLYAFWAPTDLKAVQDLGGPALRDAVVRIYTDHFQRATECCFEGCARCAKHRGYFVTAGPGPHRIERDAA
jgi:hypothetical protein